MIWYVGTQDLGVTDHYQGLGKTIQMLAVILSNPRSDDASPSVKSTLVVVPAGLVNLESTFELDQPLTSFRENSGKTTFANMLEPV